ncbi:reverse transcriptase-like protein [Leptotrombidium deliense]|uniref:Reverse transcriptase-like protein n=1 Tax=Leptotrombidium deliense TaxID=299467 RepID=A0A443S076_9ACAR|nr:reverse transcriptase-like protein [Leptotrombidium deliense]
MIKPVLSFEYVVKNSKDFVNKLFKINIETSDILISADVVNLYPSIPQNEAINHVVNVLHDKTKFQDDEIIKLLNLIYDSAFFKYNNHYYKQVSGLPMGANNSPILAECSNQLKEFGKYINSLRNVLIKRNNNYLQTTVYRKESHSNRYLNFNSYNPFCHKKSVITALIQRAFNIISSVEDITKELDYIRCTLTGNNYPLDLINKIIKETQLKIIDTEAENENTNTKPLVMPYINGVTEPISRLFHKYNINIFHKSNKQIKHFFNNKAIKINKNVVYEVNCKDCPAIYIGQTKRDLTIRMKEHRDAIFTDPNKSAVATHSVDHCHCVNFNHPNKTGL